MAVAETVAAALIANINPPPQLCLKDSPKKEWTMFKRLFNNYRCHYKTKSAGEAISTGSAPQRYGADRCPTV